MAEPAGAATNAGLAVNATVTFAPGLSSTPASQTVQVAGPGVLTVVRHGRLSPVTVNCSFSGGSVGTEDVVQGTGTLGGGCGTTAGELLSVSCGMTYHRASGVMALTGGCMLAMADGMQSTVPTGTLTVELGTAQPVTAAPGRAVVDLATAEAGQAVAGVGYSYYYPASSYNPYPATAFIADATAAGVFTSGPKAEAGIAWCWMTGYGPTTLVHQIAEGTATVRCNGTGLTGQSIRKECSLPFTLLGATLTMTGQCTLWVGGFPTQVFESHSYALVFGLRGGPLTNTFDFTGSQQAVAP